MSQNTSPTDSRRNSGTADVSGNKPKKFLNGWTKEQETLMAEWSDVASCYRWLHDRAEKKYYGHNLSITIPVIILSTLTGAANFAVGSFIPEGQTAIKGYVSAGLGGISIFAGILTTLGNFFQYAQKSESNRVASISWGKFQRLIAVELAINPIDRIDAMDFLKICRQDLDRLIEQAPQIPDDIIAAFEREFKQIPNLKFPDICHGIEHTRVFNSSKARLAQVAADAVVHLRYKKNILAKAVMPEIDKQIERELNTRIEKRIKELLPGTPEPEDERDLTGLVVSMETDWRRLLVNRRQLLQMPLRDLSGGPLPEVRAEDVRINIVGQDGHLPPTPAPPDDAQSQISERSVLPPPPLTPEVGFN
jgi:hypothetical protein